MKIRLYQILYNSVLFLIGPTLRIIFFGGYMFGKDYFGIW